MFFLIVLDGRHTFPSNVKVIKIDYSDKNAITKALIRQDVAISTAGIAGFSENFDKTLVEAVLEAGVRWVIPDEFNVGITHSLTAELSHYASKIADVSFIQQQALALFEKYTDAKWTVNHVSTKEELKNAEKSLKKSDLQNGIRPYVMAVVYNGEGACNFEGKTSNKALGLETYPFEQIVKEAVERNIAVH